MRKHELFIQKMSAAGLDNTAIKAFQYYFDKTLSGESGHLAEPDIQPPDNAKVIPMTALTESTTANLDKLAVIKLNGGLGTSMGLTRCKSLLPVKKGFTFLDIIASQILYIRKKTSQKVPLLFMHSFSTQQDSLKFLGKYPSLPLDDLPLDFVQNKFPRVRQDTLEPLSLEDDRKNWNPPGHGEIYQVLAQSGLLDALLKRGVTYAFISNSDNLGATVEPRILNYMTDTGTPFLMEVCNRTEMDKKGGHLAENADGKLVLRESAQCPADEVRKFQDIQRYRYFNTNNLWVHLPSLKAQLDVHDAFLPLSLIKNPKTVDGVDVFQLESAMGAAITLFDDAKALVVPRERFLPVKKTNDLLGLWSDAYSLHPDWTLRLASHRITGPLVALDEVYFKTIDQLTAHTEKGVPSLKNCASLVVKGDVSFGKNVTIQGDAVIQSASPVTLENVEISGIYRM